MNNCKKYVHHPQTDDDYEGCPNGYTSSDCIYPSRFMDLSGLDLPENPNMTQVFNAQQKAFRELRSDLDKAIGLGIL